MIGSWQVCAWKDKKSSSFNNTIPCICIEDSKESLDMITLMFVSGRLEIEYSAGENPLREMGRGRLRFIQIFYTTIFSINVVLSIFTFFKFLKRDEKLITFPKGIFLALILGKKKEKIFFLVIWKKNNSKCNIHCIFHWSLWVL